MTQYVDPQRVNPQLLVLAARAEQLKTAIEYLESVRDEIICQYNDLVLQEPDDL